MKLSIDLLHLKEWFTLASVPLFVLSNHRKYQQKHRKCFLLFKKSVNVAFKGLF